MVKLLVTKEVKFKLIYLPMLKKIVNLVWEQNQKKQLAEVNLIIVNDAQILNLNQKYRHKNKISDVLAFPNSSQDYYKMLGYHMLGDIYINPWQLERQAKSYNHSLKREWAWIFTHGFLHLLGYDHQTKRQTIKMEALSLEIMSKIKVLRG